MAPVISVATRGRIAGLHQAGKSVEEIINLTNCNETTIRRWIQRWEEGGDEALADNRKNNKRPRITTPEENEALVNSVKNNPFKPVSNSLRKLDLDISTATARRRLNEAGLHCRRPARKNAYKPNDR